MEMYGEERMTNFYFVVCTKPITFPKRGFALSQLFIGGQVSDHAKCDVLLLLAYVF